MVKPSSIYPIPQPLPRIIREGECRLIGDGDLAVVWRGCFPQGGKGGVASADVAALRWSVSHFMEI